jgi:hypothetical protein
VGVIAIAVLSLHAASFLPFLSDDALISLRYAQRLLDGFGLTWTEGPPVEGYSNLSWVLACAALGWLGVDLIDASRALGWVASVAALLAVLRVARPFDLAGSLPAFAGTLSIALSGTIAAWTFGGLEQPLVAGLLAWAVAFTYPLLEDGEPAAAHRGADAWLAGSMLALLCLTRPDGPLFTAAACAGVLAVRRLSRASLAACVRLAALSVLAVVLQTAFRWFYYGAWIPNTALVKLGTSGTRLLEGALYLSSGLGSHLPLVLLAGGLAAFGCADARGARRLRFLAVLLAAWCVYAGAVGGDIFPAYRTLTAVVVLLAFAVVEGLRGLRELVGAEQRRIVLGTAFALLAMVPAQSLTSEFRRAREETWEWDGQVVGQLLARAFGEARPLLAVDPAGSVPYFSGLPALDMLGLTDRYIALHPPADFGSGWIGHELGDGDYVLSREPDLVMFCTPAGGAEPCFRSGSQLSHNPDFHNRYRLVHLEGDDPYVFRSRLWARFDGGAIGVQRRGRRITVPAHLLSANLESVARLGADSKLYVTLDADTPAGISALAVSYGRWNLAVHATGGDFVTIVSPTASGSWEINARGRSVDFEVRHGDPQHIDVQLRAATAADVVELRGLSLRRLSTPQAKRAVRRSRT